MICAADRAAVVERLPSLAAERPDGCRALQETGESRCSLRRRWPVSGNCGKKAALATPTLAFAATRLCLGWRNQADAGAGPREAGRDFGQMGLISQRQTAIDGAGIPAQQDAELFSVCSTAACWR